MNTDKTKTNSLAGSNEKAGSSSIIKIRLGPTAAEQQEPCVQIGAPRNVMEAAGGEPLSKRELEVLRVMAEGFANRNIAQRLFVSEAT